MAQFTPGESFENGQQVTAERLMNHVGGAIALPGLIIDQPSFTAPDKVSDEDSILVYDSSGNGLKKSTVQEFLGSGFEKLVVDSIESTHTLSIYGSRGLNDPEPTIELGDPLLAHTVFDTTLNDPFVTSVPYELRPKIWFNESCWFKGNVGLQGSIGIKYGYVKSAGGIIFNNTSLLKLPSGPDGQRPVLSTFDDVFDEVNGDEETTTEADMTGLIRFNTTSNRAEVHNGTEWKQINQNEDILYKTFTRQITTAPGVTSWTEASDTWQWRTGSEISVPTGETWEYVVWISGGSTGWGNTRPEYNHHARLYIGDTVMRDVQCRISTYSGQWFAVLKINVESTDTTSPKRIGLKFVKGGGTGGAGIRSSADGLQILVSVTKRKKSDDTEINNIL